MDIKDIVAAFPVICKDPSEVLYLFLSAYPEEVILPVVSNKFGPKLGIQVNAL